MEVLLARLMQHYSDPWLLALARSGDKEAFSQLMTRYQPMAFRLAVRLVGNRESAYELVQEAMLQAYLSLEHLRETLLFKSWFYGIVLNVCRSFLRAQKQAVRSLDELLIVMPEEELMGMQLDPYEEIEERELHSLMQRAIEQLSPRNQDVIRLYYYGQLSVREIAEQLGISVVAVKGRLQQARKELRTYLFRHDPELAGSRLIAQRRIISMHSVTIVDVVQQDYYSVAMLMDQVERRVLPLRINYSEGQAILSVLQNASTSTPLTFAFMTNLLQAVASEVVEVRLEQLREDTLYAVTKLRQGTIIHEIEGRPGDALALAMQTTSPILVAEEIMRLLGVLLPVAQGKLSMDELETLLNHVKTKQARINTSLTEKGSPYQMARQPRNLDFRDGTVGWVTGGRDAQNYGFEIDQNVKYNDAGSLSLKSKVAQPGHFTAVIQMIDAEDYWGKRVRLSALLKTEAVAPRAMLCIYAYDNTTVLGQKFNDAGPLSGTNDWQRCTSTLNVPQDCKRLGFGMLLSGTGQVWMNDVQFAVSEPAQVDQAKPAIVDAPYNLDFSQGISGWDIWQNSTFSYLYGIDTNMKVSGQGSLYLRSRNKQAEGQVGLIQSISVESYRGKRVRISGFIKAQDIVVWGGLWVTINGVAGGMIFNSNVQQDRQHDLGIIGSHDWQEYSIVLDVPVEGSRIHYGIGLLGQGQIWLDHLTFQTVGPEVSVTTRS